MKVLVLMSTYNGEKFLSDQICSIICQEKVQVSLLVRDDGSTDDTINILDHYRRMYPEQVQYYTGPNIGVKESFFDLIENCDKSYDFYAFADQDDIWCSDKLYRAISMIEEKPKEEPVLYCSRTTLVKDNIILGNWPPIPKRALTVQNALVENISVGCTVVLNKSGLILVLKLRPDTKKIIMHDWWMYLCFAAFGKVIFDSDSRILYRQHSNNHIGADISIIRKWLLKVRRFLRNVDRNVRSIQAEHFIDVVKKNDLKISNSNIIEALKLKSYRNYSMYQLLRYAFNSRLYRQSSYENVYLKLLIILKRL